MNALLLRYELFLFDFDGLLVDTEPVHYAAYAEMCQRRGYTLEWTVEEYCKAAHVKSQGMRDALLVQFPGLLAGASSWDQLYAEKKQIYLQMLLEGKVQLMPGAEALLTRLQTEQVKHAVVTNSPREQIEVIKESSPVLQKIPLWLTREDYELPKPAPDGYLKAIERMEVSSGKVIGFEDSLKGLQSLCAAGVTAVLVCPLNHPQLEACGDLEKIHVETLESVFDLNQK
jgi:HAD superfamily hydrolase (TIGR01509 family)